MSGGGFAIGALPVIGGGALGVFMATSDALKMKLCVVVMVAVIIGGTVAVVAG